jgi:hypothetical protein
VSGPCLSSSVPDRPLRPGIRRSLGGPLPRQLADRTRTNPPAAACATFTLARLWGINPSFPGLSPTEGHVIHVLLTRAPLCRSSIATQTTPCDLHVLNTPPAFVLSQNQTLRKKFGGNDPSHLLTSFSYPKLTLADSRPPGPRAPKRRAAHNSIFFLFPALLGLIRSIAPVFPPRFLARPVLGHTVKEPSFEGTKKPIGWVAFQKQHRDRHPVSRPPSLVAAREATAPHQYQSIHFLIFFEIFFPWRC